MRTMGVTAGASEPARAIWRRLSMYWRQSRKALASHGLCSISNTTPSYFEVPNASAVSMSAGENAANAGFPSSSARMTPLRRIISVM
jgi:hypothetical protein